MANTKVAAPVCAKCKRVPTLQIELTMGEEKTFSYGCDEHRLEVTKENTSLPKGYVILRPWFSCDGCHGRGENLGLPCAACDATGGSV